MALPSIHEVNLPSFFNIPNTKANIGPATTHLQTQTNPNTKKQPQHKPRSCVYSKQSQPHKEKKQPKVINFLLQTPNKNITILIKDK
jgi:hypothetical protein